MSLFSGGWQPRTVARLLWALPVLLVVVSISLFDAGLSERSTFERGRKATAQVVDVEIRNRADVTYGHIDLRIGTPDGTIERRLPLPLSLLMSLQDRSEVAVRVLEGSSTDVVIEDIARAQWRMALIHAAMSGVGAILLIIAVGAWNRYLNRVGDPAAMAA